MIEQRLAMIARDRLIARRRQSRQALRIPATVDCTERVARSRRNDRRRKLKSQRSRAISSIRRRHGTGCPASAAVKPPTPKQVPANASRARATEPSTNARKIDRLPRLIAKSFNPK